MARSTLLPSPLVGGWLLLVAVVPKQAHAARGGGIIGNIITSDLSVGAIIGIIVGIIALCVLIALCKHYMRRSPHTTTSDPAANIVVPVPEPQPTPMTGILPTHYPQPVPGEYYPPMSPQPSTVNATDGARPVTAEEYNRIYSQIGLSGNMAASTTITMPAQTGVDTSAVPSSSVNIAPAPSIPMSPAMTHTNTISSPASMVASPYMPNTTGGISVVASPYMNSGTPVGGSAGASATRLSSLQPAPAMPYPALPPAPTLTQPFTPPSPNPPASSPATPAISMASPATTASTPSYGYASVRANASEASSTPIFTPAQTPASVPATTPAPVSTHTAASSNDPSTDAAARVRTVQSF